MHSSRSQSQSQTRHTFGAMVAMLLAALVLTGCGRGSGSHGNSGGTSIPIGAGALSVATTGVPAGSQAQISVTNDATPPAVVATVTNSSVVSLQPGNYTVTANSILTGQSLLTATSPSQAITIRAGQTTSVQVSYGSQQAFSLQLQNFVTAGLVAPIYLTAPPNDSRVFIAERAGRIRVVQNNSLLPTPLLDITALTTTQGERGLLSFAFDPNFAVNGFFMCTTPPRAETSRSIAFRCRLAILMWPRRSRPRLSALPIRLTTTITAV